MIISVFLGFLHIIYGFNDLPVSNYKFNTNL